MSGNREQLPDAVVPLGLLCLMTSTPERHERVLVDLCFEDEPLDALARELRAFEPDVVALGMRNLQNADYSGKWSVVAYYGQLVERIRSVTPAPLVLGGSGFSVIPRELMARLRPDYGIAGEGEQAFAQLLDAIERGSGFEAVGSLLWFGDDGELVVNPTPARLLDLDTLPPPDRSPVDPRHYASHAIESLQTKRGCPLRCDYCTYPLLEGRVNRLRDPRRVVDDLESILAQRPETRHLFMVDSVFNLPKTHAKAVCREMIDRAVSVPWTCYANPLGFDRELAELMAHAGCAGMEVGSDSGSEPVLERLRKGFTTAQIRELHAIASDVGIPDCHTFILGTPDESIDDVLRTLDFVVDLDPFSAILMVWIDDVETIDPERERERRALREAILELLDEHKKRFPWWSIPPLGVNYDPRLFGLLRKRGYHGPLWQHIRGLLQPAARRRGRGRSRGDGGETWTER